MSENKRKLAFWEIDAGRLGIKMQSEFEQAQIMARDRALPVSVNLSITIMPPDIEDPNYGGVIYKIISRTPVKPSKLITTELREGIIINDGDDISALLQTTLDFGESIKFSKGEGTNGK